MLMPWNIIGHDRQIERFRLAAQNRRLASTFLFVGPVGIGKRTFAQQLAAALLCQNTTTAALDPCGSCASCLQVAAGSHPDLHLVAKPPDKSMLPLELLIGDREHRMKAGLCYQMSLKPRAGKRKIAIIDDADYLNAEGANCLLKLLEEPPPGSLIVLITTHADRQLPTIRSRAQLVQFQPLTKQQLAQILEQQGFAENHQEALEMARMGQGSIDRAQRLRDAETLTIRSAIHTVLSQQDWQPQTLAETVTDYVEAAGKDAPPRRQRLKNTIEFALEYYREYLYVISGVTQPVEATHAADATDADCVRCIDSCLQAYRHVDANANLPTLTEWWLNELHAATRASHTL
ncbi:MAG: hypothetical protein CMJ75_17585 [Planctomycetaceae bacterium]|nr:hypothetical protein [Planctomycetaceae bacterium]